MIVIGVLYRQSNGFLLALVCMVELHVVILECCEMIYIRLYHRIEISQWCYSGDVFGTLCTLLIGNV